MNAGQTDFEQLLQQHDAAAWAQAVRELLPAVHEVDRNATQLWFAFFPLALQRALASAADPAQLVQKLLLQGRYRLKEQIDTSHTFLYGHRFWPAVKRATNEHAAHFRLGDKTTLGEQISTVARTAAVEAKTDAALVVGITAVAFMTVAQTGLKDFQATPGAVALDGKYVRQSPADVLRARVRDDSQGLLGFLRTTDKRWTVVWDEHNP